ncbi:MAG: putative nitrogen fixation protein NifT [Nitrospinae bacterium]|nr:putative nitrogen fixation protein NifT [Nitrospinota bacterium]
MKITIRRAEGGLSVYIPKKDLETRVIATDPAHAFGGRIECVGGLTLYIEPMKEAPALPLTVEARKL